jgi:hypothetical protein
MEDKLILHKRLNPTEYEVHRYKIDMARNLILTTRDKKFAEKIVDSYNKK